MIWQQPLEGGGAAGCQHGRMLLDAVLDLALMWAHACRVFMAAANFIPVKLQLKLPAGSLDPSSGRWLLNSAQPTLRQKLMIIGP